MSRNQQDLLEFIDSVDHLSKFQDKVDPHSSTEEIWTFMLEDMRHFLAVQASALFLVDEETREFVPTAVFPQEMRSLCEWELIDQIESGLFSYIIRRRQPAIVPTKLFADAGSVVLLPLSTVRKTLGVVLAVIPIKDSAITQEQLKLLAILGRECSLVMENAILYEHLKAERESLLEANNEIRLLSRTDSLTGCFNRGYVNERLPQEVKRSARYHHPLSVILCDIDHFKQINDTYGHQFGDRVLVEFVACISRMIREDIDWMARYGGEEFLVVLPETSREGAWLHAERLRQRVSEMRPLFDKRAVRVTASFGVAGFEGGPDTHSPEEIISVVDRYLYQAKEGGRNRVVGGGMDGEEAIAP